MDKINVVWKSYHEPEVIARGYWDQGLLEDIFKQLNVQHFNSIYEVPIGEGAIFIVNGRCHIEDAEAINKDIAHLPWVLFIDTGDEEANFPWRDIHHPIMKVWMMLPRMNLHNDTHYKLPNGYRPETHQLLKEIEQQKKVYDWSFVGQVNHPRREQCVEAAKTLQGASGYLQTTKGFGSSEVDYKDYITVMAKSKVVLCPSGIESPDNFRLYESLEAGCVPIVDAFATNNQDWGFWRYLLGDDMPFPIVGYWDALPKVLPELLADYPANANRCFAWWQLKKREIKYRLIDDVKGLSK